MKTVLFMSFYFSKKLTFVSLGQKDLKKRLIIKVNIKKFI